MKKLLPLALCLTLCLTACAQAESRTGKAKGYGGELTVAVTLEGEKITSVEVVDHKETEGVGTPAIEKLPGDIVAKGSTDVDIVSGATVTSKAIIAAVNNAINPDQYPAPAASPTTDVASADQTFGVGMSTLGRIGPGKDNEDVQVYSFNVVFASALFDKDGRIADLFVDQLEVATPNYDGAGMPQFGGFPGQGGYNWDENKDGTVDQKLPDTDEQFLADIEGWRSKRQRGDSYRMNSGTWSEEMDAFQRLFIGKTVDEIDQWFKAYCSDVNGRPLVKDSANEQDAQKYEALTDQDKAMLADVTSSATMSLNDGHGNILSAIRNAYEARRPINTPVQ